MRKFFAMLFVFSFFNFSFCFSQEKSNHIIINKQVKVVDYNYQYVFIELISSLHCSLYYPVITVGTITENQQFFEQGRNIRPGFDFGILQTVKAGKWALIGGLSYQLYNELFSYNEYLTRQLTIQNQDGNLQTITVTQGEPVAYSRNNRLGYLKLPIGVGFYPNYFKNKLGMSLLLNYHYLLLTNYMTKYSATQPAGFIAFKNFNPSFLSLSGSILFHAKIYRNLSITIEPYFNYGLNNLIDQDDLTFGMNEIGLRTGLTLFY
jgi:hypothetical protein